MSGGRGGRGSGRKRAAAAGGRGASEPPAFCDDVMSEVQALFSKVKGYGRPEGEEWRLPEAGLALTDAPHVHPRLQQLKHSLNAVKNQLSDQDLDTWHTHTCATNRAGTVTAHLRSTANAELCTQAWAKFYEVLGTFDLLPAAALRDGELHSVHLCEAPGAFVSALNHFLRTTSCGLPCDWTWLANTLNPYHEANGRTHTIADDRLLARTLPWWFFGSDNTGDIMRQEHLLELQALVRRHGDSEGTHLVTADGSFDCQEDPGEQEAAVAPLQLCEAVCALMVLAPGGSLVLKMFTLLEHSSVCLLYLLACCFSQLSVFKPATSKPGNSELYLVCVGFRPPPSLRPLLAKLVRLYGPDMTRGGAVGLFPVRCIPDSFLRQHEEVCAFFHDLQVATIRENLELFTTLTGSEVTQRMEHVRECTALYYTQRFQVRSLSRKSWLTRGVCVSGVWALGSVWSGLWAGPAAPHHQRHHQQRGSYNQRQQQRTHTWRQRLTHTPFHQWAQGHRTHTHTHAHTHPTLSGAHGHDPLTWYLVVGGALDQVRSSAFCEPGLLGLLNQALAESGGQGGVGGRGGGVGGQTLPVCFGCVAVTPHGLLAELSARPDVTSCLVLGEPAWWGVSSSPGGVSSSLGGVVEFCADACPAPWPGDRPLLHDGEPSYQRDLLRAVLAALPRLRAGGALVVPLRSALSRVTAGVILALQLSFHSVAFRCPSPGPAVCVVCVGLLRAPPDPPLVSALQEALEEMMRVEGGGARQVLQVAPMEELLRGDLPHFLCCLNAAVIRQRLHLMLQHDHHS